MSDTMANGQQGQSIWSYAQYHQFLGHCPLVGMYSMSYSDSMYVCTNHATKGCTTIQP
jgi:hypothetical protein